MDVKAAGTVVVGVAASTFGGQALPWAAEQARLEGRPVTLVNASGPVSGAWREYGMNAVPASSVVLRERGQALLDRARLVVEAAVPGVEVRDAFDVVDPSTLLIQLSSTAHLLVLGSRGRGPVRSHLLGSVGLVVARHSACPVVVHRPGDHPARVHRGVLVAADATEESKPVLAFAFRQASLRSLPLKVVHYVYDARSALIGNPMLGSLSEDTDAHEVALSESLAGFREDYPDVHVSVEMLPALLPEEGLASLNKAADLTVVGTRQRGVLGRIVAGTVSGSLLEHAVGPVAVVPTTNATAS